MKRLLLCFLLLLSLSSQAAGLWANRFVTYDTLLKIFGPSSHKILEENILKQYEVFGGACSLMETNFGSEKNNSGLYYCRNGSAESKTKPYAHDLIRRNALVLSTCRKLVHSPKSFNHLIAKTILLPRAIDRAQKIYEEFYPFIKADKELIFEALLLSKKQLRFPFKNDVLFRNRYNDYELLRNFTYYFCISEKWQKI